MNAFFFELITRDRCPLCEEGEAVVRKVASLHRVSVRVVQVESNDEILGTYALRIPVVRDPSGRVLDEGRLSAGRLFWQGVRVRLARG